MNSSSLKTTCNVLSVVDFLLIGGMFFYFQKKISNIEKGGFTSTIDSMATSTPSTPSTPSTSSEKKESSSKIIEKRVLRLEKDNEVLLQRMQFYDELFSKILSHIKENKDHGSAGAHAHHQTLDPSVSPVRKTYLQRRSSDSLLTRKEPFIDESEAGESEAGEYKSGVIPDKIKEIAASDGEDGEDDYEEDMFSYLKN